MIKKNKKGALQISFAWLFAIIVGAFILFLAIYGVTKLIGTEKTISDAEVGKEISVLLNPLETGFETGKITSLTMPVETRIYNKCSNEGVFGKQRIQISQLSFNEWTDSEIEIGSPNKYLFSEEYAEGKKFYLFSKPFELSFKVTDLIYIIPSTDIYCFLDPPEDVEQEISNLNQRNFLLEDCPQNSINVCFGSNSDCDISVNYVRGAVEKNNREVDFITDALMYAAIFSDKEVYECQLRRVMKRTESLASLYSEKSSFIAQQGCSSELETELLILKDLTGSYDDSAVLFQIESVAEQLENKNNVAGCKLW